MLKIRLLVLSIVTLSLSAAPAMAEMKLYFDIHATELTISDNGDGTYDGDGEASVTSDVDAYLLGSAPDSTTIDPLTASMFNFDLTFSGSGENWTAAGSLLLQDTVGDKVGADISANSVDVVLTAIGYELVIQGPLSTRAGEESILLTSGAWTYTGSTGFGDIGLASGAENWDSGAVIIAHFNLPNLAPGNPIDSISELFSWVDTNGNMDLVAGNVEITVVPVPAAVLLGILGLGVAGWKMRKYA